MEIEDAGRKETEGKWNGVEKSKVNGGLVSREELLREAGRIQADCGINWIKMWNRSQET